MLSQTPKRRPRTAPLFDYRTNQPHFVSSFNSNPRVIPGVAGVLQPKLYYRTLLRDSAFERPNRNLVVNNLKGPDILDPEEDVLENFDDPIEPKQTLLPQPPGSGTGAGGTTTHNARADDTLLKPKKEEKIKKEETSDEIHVPPSHPPEESSAESQVLAVPKKLSPEEYKALTVAKKSRAAPTSAFLPAAKKHKFKLV